MNHLITFLFLIPCIGFAQYSENDWDERDKWMDTRVIFEMAGITKGSFVADIGCHEGYLSVRLARKVGEDGRVYAVDVVESRLETLKENLKNRALFNVNTVLGDFDNPKLPKGTLDVVVIMDTYHEMKDYFTILRHAKDALKPGGRIVIIEKLKTRVKGKSRDTQTDAHSLGTKYVKQELKKVGFNILNENNNMGNWENDVDKVIWMLVAIKPK